MHTIHTQLWHFKYNSAYNNGPQNVIWYKLDEVGNGVPFNNEESLILSDYFANHSINFVNQNCHVCSPEDGIFCFSSGKPKNQLINVIVRSSPKLPASGFIPRCVDIKLCNQKGVFIHDYNLDFAIIGKII